MCVYVTIGCNGVRVCFSGLTLRRMFETAVGDGANQLGLQKEVAETSRVDADIGTFLVDAFASRSLGLLAVGRRGGLLGLELLVGVVDQILLSRHGGRCCRWSESVARRRCKTVQETRVSRSSRSW